MNKQLAIIETEINWKEIIELALNKKGWGKKHTLLSRGKASIIAEMYEFNFSQNRAIFKLRIIYDINERKVGENSFSNYSFVHYYLENFKLEEFDNLVKRRIITLINEIYERETKEAAQTKYHKLRVWNANNAEYRKKFNLQKEYDQIQEIEDDNIKEKLEEAFEDAITEKANEEFNEKVKEFCEEKISIPSLDEIKQKIEKDEEERIKKIEEMTTQ